jgi:uncharacterized protein (UPF0332 family)
LNIEELVKKELILKTKTTSNEIEGSLFVAEHFIERAKGNMKIGYSDIAFSLAYQAMFHCARALLFKNNFKERSHHALISALK